MTMISSGLRRVRPSDYDVTRRSHTDDSATTSLRDRRACDLHRLPGC